MHFIFEPYSASIRGDYVTIAIPNPQLKMQFVATPNSIPLVVLQGLSYIELRLDIILSRFELLSAEARMIA